MTVTAGQTTTLLAQFYDHPSGTLVDLDATPTVQITSVASGATALAATTSGVTHPGTGSYGYAWTPASDLTPGDYLVTWSGLKSSTAVNASETVTVLAPASSAATNTSVWRVWYCTREDVKTALDSMETARNNTQVDRACEAAARSVEGQLKRRFYPLTATRYWDWPNDQRAYPWRLWFDQHDLISLTTLVSGGVTVPSTGYFLSPVNTGPPYTSIELRLDSQYAFSVGATFQRSVQITGLWGYTQDEDTAGALAAAVSDTTSASINVSDSSAIGVGSILRIDSERLIVTAKAALTTGQTGTLTALDSADQLAVSDGTKFTVGEVLTLDTERMLIVDIIGNTLTVKRAWDGTVLAAHTTATIYAARTLAVQRGALGTTAATHANATPIAVHRFPGLVRNLAVAEALLTLGLEPAGYVRTMLRGDSRGKPIETTIDDLRKQALDAHGRHVRHRAV